MSDQIETTTQEEAPLAPKKGKKAEAPLTMDSMNLEALHRRIDRWGIAAVCSSRVVQLRPAQLKILVDKSLEAADIILAVLDAEGTEGKA